MKRLPRLNRRFAICASVAASAAGLGAAIVEAQSLLLFVVVAFLVLPIMAGAMAAIAGLRSWPALALTAIAIAAFAAGYVFVDNSPSNHDGEVPVWLNAALLAGPALVVVALSMTIYAGVRAARSTSLDMAR